VFFKIVLCIVFLEDTKAYDDAPDVELESIDKEMNLICDLQSAEPQTKRAQDLHPGDNTAIRRFEGLICWSWNNVKVVSALYINLRRLWWKIFFWLQIIFNGIGCSVGVRHD
jgi:hypothetical protein